MLHVGELELEHFGPFRGKHRAELGPGIYAVTAQREVDHERSNYVGKSWFLSAIPFALFGWHLADTEDGFINDQEKTASVCLKLSDGSEVERSRKKTTQLVVKLPGAGEQKGEAAQAALLRHLGLTERDYFATSFFEQKKVSQLVTMSATDRQELVRGWLDLGRLERAEQLGWDQAKIESDQLVALQAADKVADEYWAAIQAEYQFTEAASPREGLEKIVVELEAAIERAQEVADEATAELALATKIDAAKRFAELNQQGQALRAQVDALPEVTPVELEGAEQNRQEAYRKLAVVSDRADRALQAVRGGFDGTCPIAGIACPAKDIINGKSAEAAKLVKALTAEEGQLKALGQVATQQLSDLRAKQQAKAQLVAELNSLRGQAQRTLAAAQGAPKKLGRPKWDQPPEERLRLAQSRQRICHESLASTRVDLARGLACEAKRADEQAKLEAQRRVTAARATAKIYRKAQRLVAERNMGEVERGANAALDAIGSGLSVQLQWQRQGQDLASSCEECGAAFPKSLKIKECAGCGAKRGPSLVERLEVALSHWSGAAEDLAGMAIQLSASAWLRQKKGARWASACIDEPFGALDVANRRELSQQLQTLLSGRFGFAQAFVVAHDRAVMAALPHRIELVGGREGTRIG